MGRTWKYVFTRLRICIIRCENIIFSVCTYTVALSNYLTIFISINFTRAGLSHSLRPFKKKIIIKKQYYKYERIRIARPVSTVRAIYILQILTRPSRESQRASRSRSSAPFSHDQIIWPSGQVTKQWQLNESTYANCCDFLLGDWKVTRAAYRVDEDRSQLVRGDQKVLPI